MFYSSISRTLGQLRKDPWLLHVLLLHFDLLVGRQKNSIYREEAVDAITVALGGSLSDKKIRSKCCKALLILGGCFSSSGKIMTEDWMGVRGFEQKLHIFFFTLPLFVSNKIQIPSISLQKSNGLNYNLIKTFSHIQLFYSFSVKWLNCNFYTKYSNFFTIPNNMR